MMRAQTGNMNDTIRDAATEAGVHFVSVEEIFAGHEVCGGDGDDEDEWIKAVADFHVGLRWGWPPVDAGAGDASFHPKPSGHRAYARALRDFIWRKIVSGWPLTPALLPENPSPIGGTFAARGPAPGAASSPGSARTTTDDLIVSRTAPASCPSDLALAPGAAFRVRGEGFVPSASVALRVVPSTGLPIDLATLTAGADGRIDATSALPPGVGGPQIVEIDVEGLGADAAPRLLFAAVPIEATAAPCVGDDFASTASDPVAPLAVDVLANDVGVEAPLVPSTVSVTMTPDDGAATVESGTYRMLYAPDPGFTGTDALRYEVCDALGVCARGIVTIDVTSGCTILGTPGDDAIEGTPGDDVICGDDGNDTIAGAGGNDRIFGGRGDDVLDGGDGDDVLHGEEGDDDLRGREGHDRLFGDDGVDRLVGGAGNDRLEGGDDADTLYAGAGDDTALGGPGDDYLEGGDDEDVLEGGGDDDELRGGEGNDTLRGEGGDDQLFGEGGNDLLDGGSGVTTRHDEVCGNGVQEYGETCDDGGFAGHDGCDAACHAEGTACADGIDDDGDGLVDWPADPGCASATDTSERSPTRVCDDGLDDDGDGLVDLPTDPGCWDGAWFPKHPLCNDGLDNDGDGLVDLADPVCAGAYQKYEAPLAPSCGLLGIEGWAALGALRSMGRGAR